jgi:hypothetical protein
LEDLLEVIAVTCRQSLAEPSAVRLESLEERASGNHREEFLVPSGVVISAAETKSVGTQKK